MYLYYQTPKETATNLVLVDDNDNVIVSCDKNAPFDSGLMKYGNDMNGLTDYLHSVGAIRPHDVVCYVYG